MTLSQQAEGPLSKTRLQHRRRRHHRHGHRTRRHHHQRISKHKALLPPATANISSAQISISPTQIIGLISPPAPYSVRSLHKHTLVRLSPSSSYYGEPPSSAASSSHEQPRNRTSTTPPYSTAPAQRPTTNSTAPPYSTAPAQPPTTNSMAPPYSTAPAQPPTTNSTTPPYQHQPMSKHKALPPPATANISSTQNSMPPPQIFDLISPPSPYSVRSLFSELSPGPSCGCEPPTQPPSIYEPSTQPPYIYEPSTQPPYIYEPPTQPPIELPPSNKFPPPIGALGPSPPVPHRRPPSRPSLPTSEPSPKRSVSVPLVVGVTFGAIAALLLILLFLFLQWRRRKREHVGSPNPENVPPQTQSEDEHHRYRDLVNPQQESPQPQNQRPIISIPPQPLLPIQDTNSSSDHSKNTFSYEDLEKATDGFSKDNILGHGGFGSVYKGILTDGTEVAVKQLSSGSWQGEREFQAEVEIISRVHHRHLVSLVGYCVTEQTMLLVYEYVPNGTLEFHLHDKEEPTLDWPTRMKAALGSAKGLAYLHQDCRPKIIHRDIKAANILLDNEFEAQVADFGLAKFFTDSRTHVTTRVVGTFGYLAPEYAASGKLTEKSDVFSFGIVLLELITGRRPVDKTLLFENDNMVDWAMPLMLQALQDNNYETIVDKRLKNNYNPNEMKRMVASAVACIRHSVRHRPKMSQVARILEGDVSIEDLNQGVSPGHSKFYYGSSGSSSHISSGKYNVRKKNTGRTNYKEDQTSSEYTGESTGESNPFPTGSSYEV